MRFQTRPSSCGPSSIRNALEALGHVRAEDELIRLTGQTAEGGTPPKRMLRALLSLKESCGLKGPDELHERDGAVAILKLLECLRAGRPAICCVKTAKPWDHWAMAGGLLGSSIDDLRIISVDGADNDMIRFRRPVEFVEWWMGPAEARRPFYAVVL